MLKLFKFYWSKEYQTVIPIKKSKDVYLTIRLTDVSTLSHKFYTYSLILNSFEEFEPEDWVKQRLISYIFEKPDALKF